VASSAGGLKNDALLRGFALVQAQSWLDRRAEDLLTADKEFIGQSIIRQRVERSWMRKMKLLVSTLILCVVAGYAGWLNQSFLKEQIYWLTNVRGHVLSVKAERALKRRGACRR
jgi:hypothetical protein